MMQPATRPISSVTAVPARQFRSRAGTQHARVAGRYPTPVVALIGGHFKGGDFRDLRDVLVSRGRAVVAMGEAAPLVREALADVLARERRADTR